MRTEGQLNEKSMRAEDPEKENVEIIPIMI